MGIRKTVNQGAPFYCCNSFSLAKILLKYKIVFQIFFVCPLTCILKTVDKPEDYYFSTSVYTGKALVGIMENHRSNSTINMIDFPQAFFLFPPFVFCGFLFTFEKFIYCSYYCFTLGNEMGVLSGFPTVVCFEFYFFF